MSILSATMKRKKLAKRGKPIFVRATADEHVAFNNLAVARNTNLSELIRQLLHREVAQSQQVSA